jgi:hypothetical protein
MLFQRAALLPANYPALILDADEKVGVVFVEKLSGTSAAVGNWLDFL